MTEHCSNIVVEVLSVRKTPIRRKASFFILFTLIFRELHVTVEEMIEDEKLAVSMGIHGGEDYRMVVCSCGMVRVMEWRRMGSRAAGMSLLRS